jgi:hypothetical protein
MSAVDEVLPDEVTLRLMRDRSAAAAFPPEWKRAAKRGEGVEFTFGMIVCVWPIAEVSVPSWLECCSVFPGDLVSLFKRNRLGRRSGRTTDVAEECFKPWWRHDPEQMRVMV